MKTTIGVIRFSDVLRISVGLFMVWLSWALLDNLDKGTAEFLIQQGVDSQLLAFVIGVAGAIMVAHRWGPHAFAGLTLPLLIYSTATVWLTAEQNITPVAAGFQVMCWVVIVLYSGSLVETARLRQEVTKLRQHDRS